MENLLIDILIILTIFLIVFIFILLGFVLSIILKFKEVLESLKQLIDKGHLLMDKVDYRAVTILSSIFKLFKK